MQNLKTVKTSTANDKYSLLNRDTLTQPMQMQLSQKQETFSQLSMCSFKIYINFSTFPKKR